MPAALLPLARQNAYRDRYRAIRPGWRTSGEELESLVRGHLTQRSHVLDLGCGRGGLVEVFWRDVRLAAGLDPDVPSLAEHRAQGMPVIRGRGEHLPFADESFDVVVCLWVLEHLERPEEVFTEVRRVLKPQGHFAFLTPNLRNPLLLLNRLAKGLPHVQSRVVSRLYGRVESDTFQVRYRANTEAKIRALAARCGLQVALLKAIPDPTYLALNELMFRASVASERLVPARWGVHLLGDLTPA
jgi:2-polyprenyl-3-methyl-5-hydroxy-6-metoxy-1,4-benzoquinol methylase